jgi:hypothetical protein
VLVATSGRVRVKVDELNRLEGISYNTSGTTAQPTPAVSIIYGNAAPKKGLVKEVKHIDGANSPWKESYA